APACHHRPAGKWASGSRRPPPRPPGLGHQRPGLTGLSQHRLSQRGLSGSSARVQYAPRVRIHGVFRGIGSFAVKFRWFVLVAWIIAAVAIASALPSLSSVTQGNNANFLPASAPSEHALKLAGPLGGSTLTPVPVVAASAQGALSAADQSWLQKLEQDLGHVPTVVKVRDLGRSPDGQAAQLQVLSNVSQGGSGSGLTTLVNDLRAQIAKVSPPSGLSVHLAGAVPINVDQQS